MDPSRHRRYGLDGRAETLDRERALGNCSAEFGGVCEELRELATDSIAEGAEHCLRGEGNRVTHFSRATTKSGAHNSARLFSESGKWQIALRAESAYWVA